MTFKQYPKYFIYSNCQIFTSEKEDVQEKTRD